MINLFRKVRRQFAEDNKPKKYMRYAIGEILLVVIGILMALQINNWNENRKHRESAYLHLLTLTQNLKDDMQQLSELQAAVDTTISSANKLMLLFKQINSVNKQTMLHIANLALEYNFFPDKSGLESLNNSGEMAYIDKDLQMDILNYYTLLNQIQGREEISNTFIKNHYESYLINEYNFLFSKDNPWIYLEPFYLDDNRPEIQIEHHQIGSDKKLEAITIVRLFQTQTQRNLYADAIKLANQILNSIKK